MADERPVENSNPGPERGGSQLMVAVLIVSAFMCIGSIGGAGYFAWRAARNVIDREKEARENQQLAVELAEQANQTRRLEKLGQLIATDMEAKGLPQDIRDDKGQAILSWRVRLLASSSEDAELFKQFRLNEPWDGPNNRKLLDRRPDMYAPPRVDATGVGDTYIRGLTTEGMAFGPMKAKLTHRPRAEFTANLADVVVVFESGESTPWTRPDQFPWPKGQRRPSVGGPASSSDAFFAITANGRVREIKRTLPDSTLRSLFEIDQEKRPTVRLTPDMRR